MIELQPTGQPAGSENDSMGKDMPAQGCRHGTRLSMRATEDRLALGAPDRTGNRSSHATPTTRKSLWRWFVWNELLSSAFPVYIFVLLAGTRYLHVPGVSRYDLLLILCLAAQAAFVRFRYETMREFKVIMAFHVIGLILEIYKTHFHAWAYPGPSILHIAGVPLYSGFMYASVASYLCQAWRRLNLRLTNVPNWNLSCALAVAIYVNFFTERFFYDLRWVLITLVFIHFRRTRVSCGPTLPSNPALYIPNQIIRMPLAIGLLLVGVFVWFAENFGTLCGAWQYPNQHHGWAIVHASKLGSWFLLVVIEFLIVAKLKYKTRNVDRPAH